MTTLLLNHPMMVEEKWENFTQIDHNTWNFLFQRQSQLLDKYATPEIFEGITKLKMSDKQIPKFYDLNKILNDETGFIVVPVKGYIEHDLFFKLLSERKFPSTCFIRKPEQMDYLEEPDLFHELFGHIPLLANPVFADFIQKFGHLGLKAIEYNLGELAARLYWFTVEFGLIKIGNKLNIYGAGIISSKSETIYSIDSDIPKRLIFNLNAVMKTSYQIDNLQTTYFIINNFKELFDAINELDWKKVMQDNLRN